ncbi:C-type polyheme cytochrome OmcB [Geotalea uraniireducens]|uniref:C-type polyheme cytochrome OmcB n=1 Tax=Geotalea uraniireducens TaxID=351604 RepID=A0ABN6VZ48_9BACT|nr:multiheme c-type cytochrome [Geotalea uraniireducens]BDV43947.1 C-type polyheme cytochrome OmcB [Geotalea uraniireducens]
MSRTASKYAALLAAFVMTAALAGCGSGNKEGSNTTGFGGVASVGDTACIQCHSAVTDPLTGEGIVAQYQQNSPHNQDGLGCESCHGGGAQHNGVGPIPYPTPDANRCAACHDGTQSFTVGGVATVAPSTNANTAFDTSNHVEGTPSHTSGLCIRCHTHEGAVLSNQSGFTGELASGTIGTTTYPGVLDNAAYGPPVVTSGYTAFKCETCHQHGGGLRGVKGRDNNGNLVLWNPSKSGKTDQFNLCTSCHNLYNYNQTRVIGSNTAASGTLKYEHNTRWNRTILSTHREKGMASLLTLPFANMTSAADSSNTWITGYVIRLTNTTDPNYKGPCFDCHGHEAKTNTSNTTNDPTQATIHTDWGRSGHAGGLLNAKYAAAAANLRTAAELDAVTQAYVDTNTSTWSHYNWDSTLKSDGTDDRGSCQKCHTATGLSNYLNSPTTYDPLNNSFSHLIGWNQKGGSKRQNELLYCWGCHKDAGTGALRNPGAITVDYTYNSAAITLPNVSKSNVCVVCHAGRGNTQSARSSRFAGHHAPAAGTLFSAQTHIGWEYPGADYTNKSYFEHDKIGTAAVPGTGTNGPCVACHMSGSSHTYNVLTDDGTAIRSQALCDACHTTHPMSKAILDEEQAGYANASALLKAYVANTITNYLGIAITGSNYSNTTTVPDGAYGAFQNSQLIDNEAGAYAHNRYYTKRLIFDGIDWMQHGQLTGSITIDATAYPDAAVWYGAASGTTGTFTATRP